MSANIPDVAVYYLGHGNRAFIRHEVERLCLRACALHGLPSQIFRRQFCEGNSLSLCGDRLNGRRSILWFLGACNIRQTERLQQLDGPEQVCM
jgi:hypothetical protein